MSADKLPKMREWNFAGERADAYRLTADGCLLATWDAIEEHNALVRHVRAMSSPGLEALTRNIAAYLHAHVGHDVDPSAKSDFDEWIMDHARSIAALGQAAGTRGDEITRLQAEQATLVMPQIGGLLDAWSQVSNDFRSLMLEECPQLGCALGNIDAAMECADPQREPGGRR